MSTTHREPPIENCHPTEQTPVTVDAAAIDDANRAELRALADELATEDYVPAQVTATVTFEEDCSLATQRVADRLRDVVDAASFLGANRVTVDVETVACAEKAQPALDAVAERARRDGLAVDVRGVSVD